MSEWHDRVMRDITEWSQNHDGRAPGLGSVDLKTWAAAWQEVTAGEEVPILGDRALGIDGLPFLLLDTDLPDDTTILWDV